MAYFNIVSDTHTAQSVNDSLFDLMGNFESFKHLLPQDKIENFECTDTQCSFGIKGMMPLTIKIKDSLPKTKITYETLGLAKFVFTLHINLLEANTVNVNIEGDMNPFIKVMAEKPLQDLVNTMASKLSALKI